MYTKFNRALIDLHDRESQLNSLLTAAYPRLNSLSGRNYQLFLADLLKLAQFSEHLEHMQTSGLYRLVYCKNAKSLDYPHKVILNYHYDLTAAQQQAPLFKLGAGCYGFRICADRFLQLAPNYKHSNLLVGWDELTPPILQEKQRHSIAQIEQTLGAPIAALEYIISNASKT